jgi:hypothetical protein
MMARSSSFLAAALLLVACGGQSTGERPDAAATGLPVACAPIVPLSTDPDPGSGPVDCHALDDYDLSLTFNYKAAGEARPLWIGDNFETGAATGWYINNDRTALQTPAPDTDPVFGEVIPGGRCLGVPGVESRFAIHIVSGNLTDYGGVFGRNLPRRILDADPCPVHSCPDRIPYPAAIGPCGLGQGNPAQPNALPVCLTGTDASQWEGIVMWARKGPGSQSSVRIQLGDVHTDDSNQACECNNSELNPAGQLISATNQNDSSNGCDKFGMFATLTDTFRPYFFPFNTMQQGGWGKPSPGVAADQLFSITVSYGRQAWDLWIDDISFYRRKK